MPNSKYKVFQEEVKQRYVSHWDMDYIPSEQRDVLIRQQSTNPTEVVATATPLLTRIANRFRRTDRSTDGCGCCG